MSKQDRQGVRTATHLEQKYNFGETFGKMQGAQTDIRNYVNALEKALREEYNELINTIYGNTEKIITDALKGYMQTGDFEQFQKDLETTLNTMRDDISDVEEAFQDALQDLIDAMEKSIRFHPEGGVGIGRDAAKANTLQVGWAAEFGKETVFLGNSYCAHNLGTPGASGFVAVASIEITDANADAPITFQLTRRSAGRTMTVYVRFANVDLAEPDLESVKFEGEDYGAFLCQESESVWMLYVAKADPDDEITVQRWSASPYMNDRITLTFPDGVQVEELPETYHEATPVVSQSALVDVIFPVGHTLLMYDTADPNELYAGTAWEKIVGEFPPADTQISAWRRTA